MDLNTGENTTAIFTGIAGVAAALGLNKLLPGLFERSQKRHECESDIRDLTTATRMLLGIIEDKLEDDAGLKRTVEEIKEILNEIKANREKRQE
jgi:hypothetical protein